MNNGEYENKGKMETFSMEALFTLLWRKFKARVF